MSLGPARRVFAIYRSRYPRVDIRLVEYGGERLKEVLLSGEIELAAWLLPVSDEFEYQSVANEPLVILLPAKHALARKESIDLVSLQP